MPCHHMMVYFHARAVFESVAHLIRVRVGHSQSAPVSLHALKIATACARLAVRGSAHTIP